MNIMEQLCCGCAACASVCPNKCIEMYQDEYGFYRAKVNLGSCIDCGKCISVCSMHRDTHLKQNSPLSAYAAYCRNTEILLNSSSGGIFSSIAKVVIANNGVVFGSAFDDNMMLRHIMIDSLDNLSLLRGSKYLQSHIGDIYHDVKQQIKRNVPVFFVGTPCQVSALYSTLQNRPSNLLTADLICHGTPSPDLFKGYLKHLESVHRGKIIGYNFRSKEKSNSRMSYTVKLTLQTGRKIKQVFLDGDEEPYTMRFISNALQCESCYACPYANLDRPGDITLGDYWGYETAHPELSKIKGVSLLLINTVLGKKWVEELQDIELIKTYPKQYLEKNKHLLMSPVKHPDRDMIYEQFKKNGFSKSFFHNTFLPRGYKLYIFKRKVRGFLQCTTKSES